MCKPEEGFILCSCQEETKNSAEGQLLDKYVWTLTRFVGMKESLLRGKILGPSKDLGAGIESEKLLQFLNQGNCFDFTYTAAEKDSLEICINHEEEGYKYFKLLYTEGKWREGRNDPFNSINEEIAHGKIIKK